MRSGRGVAGRDSASGAASRGLAKVSAANSLGCGCVWYNTSRTLGGRRSANHGRGRRPQPGCHRQYCPNAFRLALKFSPAELTLRPRLSPRPPDAPYVARGTACRRRDESRQGAGQRWREPCLSPPWGPGARLIEWTLKVESRPAGVSTSDPAAGGQRSRQFDGSTGLAYGSGSYPCCR